MGGLKMRLTNLFENSKALGKQRFIAATMNMFFNFFHLLADDGVNQYLNDNWKIASDAVKPIIAKMIEDVMLNCLQRMFHQLPGDYLVSDLPTPEELEKKKANESENAGKF